MSKRLPVAMLHPFVFNAMIRKLRDLTGQRRYHGIFEIIAIDKDSATFRRVATSNKDCEIGETRTLPIEWLTKVIEPSNFDSFGKESHQ